MRADLGQLNQVILNLAVNARDAMPQGGQSDAGNARGRSGCGPTPRLIRVRAGPLRALKRLLIRAGGWRRMCRRGYLSPFSPTKPKAGARAGLSVVLGIVQQSGGHIEVESSSGMGTKFTIYLPAVAGSGRNGRHRALPSKPVGGSETVLLVEDEEPVQEHNHSLVRDPWLPGDSKPKTARKPCASLMPGGRRSICY